MEQLFRVKKTYKDGTALVVRVRESACSGDCHKCAGCGAAQQTVQLRATNAIDAKNGELVVVSAKTTPVLLGAAVLYLLPLVLFIAGYLSGAYLWEKGALVGCLSFLLSIVLAILYDRLVAKKQNLQYIISGYPTV